MCIFKKTNKQPCLLLTHSICRRVLFLSGNEQFASSVPIEDDSTKHAISSSVHKDVTVDYFKR